MLFPDLSLTLSQRRRACVLDPALTLSRFGLLLVRRLGEVMELWMPREFWHILDNSQFFGREPEALFSVSADARRAVMRHTLEVGEIATAMKEWERIRTESDLGGLKFFWVGDGLSESLVPPGTAPDVVLRYESLAGALDRRLTGSGPIVSAARDSAALAAALRTAFVLTHRTAQDVRVDSPPAICEVFVPSVVCQRVADDHPLVVAEREHLRHLLVVSGAASLVWAGLNLSVVHLVVPAAATLYAMPPPTVTDDVSGVEPGTPVAEAKPDPWDGALGFWYQV